MEAIKNDGGLSLHLSTDEALVLLEWIAMFNQNTATSSFNDQAEQRVLWDIEALLERNCNVIFSNNYAVELEQARANVRDQLNID